MHLSNKKRRKKKRKNESEWAINKKKKKEYLYFVTPMPVHNGLHTHNTPSAYASSFQKATVPAIKIHNTYRTFLIEINQMLQPIIPCMSSVRQLPAQQSRNSQKKKKSNRVAALLTKVMSWFNTLRLVCYSPFLHHHLSERERKRARAMLRSFLFCCYPRIQYSSCNSHPHRCPRVLGTWLLIFCVNRHKQTSTSCCCFTFTHTSSHKRTCTNIK